MLQNSLTLNINDKEKNKQYLNDKELENSLNAAVNAGLL